MAPDSTAVCQSLYLTFKWTLLREVKKKKKGNIKNVAILKIRNPTGFLNPPLKTFATKKEKKI